MMHKTSTVDYIIVLKGEIYAVMETGEKLLRAGDILVQRGTNHSWSVRGTEPCIVAAVLVSAKPVGAMKKKREEDAKSKRKQEEEVNPPRTVGVIGLGIMGSAMSGNLVKAGFGVQGYDIARRARGAGAQRAPAETPVSSSIIPNQTPVVITSRCRAPSALHAVSREMPARKLRIVVETSTLPIDEKVKARDDAEAQGHHAARLPALRHRRAGAGQGPRRCMRAATGRLRKAKPVFPDSPGRTTTWASSATAAG